MRRNPFLELSLMMTIHRQTVNIVFGSHAKSNASDTAVRASE
jgi:hypothetical protein